MDSKNSNNVLIVDDDVNILSLFKEFLTEHGYNIFVADNAKDALDIVKATSIPVIYLDLQMPEMTGIELCKEIRKFNQLTWICAITGANSLFEISKAREAGFDDYFAKPIDMAVLNHNTAESFNRFFRWKQQIERM